MKRTFCLGLFVLVAVTAWTPDAVAATVPADHDAWVTARHPSRNLGSDSVMRVSSNPVKRAFVRFTVGELPGAVQKAVLRLHAQSDAPRGFHVYSTAAGWTEETITYANAPQPGALVATAAAFTERDTWREIDVTSAVLGPGTRAFVVTAPSGSGDIVFTSKEGGRAPELVVTTGPGPDPDPEPQPGTLIETTQPWSCTGPLAAFGPPPIKVVSTIQNPGNDNAINLRGCYGDGDPATVDLILDVRGNGADLGTAYDAVRIGQDAHDLVVTGNVECGARHTDPSIHQDIVQALSGTRVTFVDFTSGDPFTGRWTCWGAGGGWYVTWANGAIPTDLVCLRCALATYNQNLRIDQSLRSGARDSVFGYSRWYGIFIGPLAIDPVNVNNRVIRY